MWLRNFKPDRGMKLVVISPEREDPREAAVLGGLLAAGLECYHVRKPHWSARQLEAWLRALPADWRPRLVLHSHHELADQFGLGGRHWRDTGGEGRGVPAEPLKQAIPPHSLPYPGITSRSCHDLPTLRAALGRYDAVFFGPIFPSISKADYGPSSDFSPKEVSMLLAQRSVEERRTVVFALGGVAARNLLQIAALGFDGAAVLGAVWQAADPLAAFHELQNVLHAHAT